MRIPSLSPPSWLPARVGCTDPGASERIAEQLQTAMAQLGFAPGEPALILCIGTDRSTGDALGPLTGSLLMSYAGLGAAVRGTLEEPVHASNLREELLRLEAGPDHLVIAVDACLGQSSQVGTLCVGCGPLHPGAGVHKNLPSVGDLHLTGTVNVGGFMEYLVLQNTRLSLVVKMAGVLARGIAQALGGNAGHRPRLVV